MPKKPYKIVTDAFGEVKIPINALYGKTTTRWIDKYSVGHPLPFQFIQTLALVKKACAFANRDCSVLSIKKAKVIGKVCDEIMQGKYKNQFPVSWFQSGSGTITNMNINEVIASLSNGLLHPNDDVNKSQSTNDIIPTAIQVSAAVTLMGKTIPAVAALSETFFLHGKKYWNTIKAGRTHLMDAVPIRLGMEFDAWAKRIKNAQKLMTQSLDSLLELPIGGTAVGSGINAPRDFPSKAVKYISKFAELPFKVARNQAVAISSHDALVEASGSLNFLAQILVSIATNIRWLSSGPRTGLSELILPTIEAGSSIMPGKVNPSHLEALQMACYKIMGNHLSTTIANLHSSEQDLNTAKPLIAELFWESATLMSDACRVFNVQCAQGIKINLPVIEKHLKNTLMLVTALTPHIGYDQATKIALSAAQKGTTLKDETLASGLVSEEDFDNWIKPEKMV